LESLNIGIIGTMGLPPSYGGAETAVLNIGKYLIKKGHNVTVYTSFRKGMKKKGSFYGIRIKYIPFIPFTKFLDFPFRSIISIFRGIIDDIDVFHFWGPDSWFYASIQRRFSSGASVITIDGPEWARNSFPKVAQYLLKITSHFNVKYSDVCVVDNKIYHKLFEKQFNTKLTYIPYGAVISDDRELDSDLLKNYNLKNKSYFLFVGRFTQEKGVHNLIKAYDDSFLEKKGIKLVLVGGEPFKGKQYESYLKKNCVERRYIYRNDFW